MTVRIATRYDIDVLVNMMRDYSSYSPVDALRNVHNEPHVRKLLTAILCGGGAAWVSEYDGVAVGMLISIRNNNTWNPDIILQQELAYWVDPEYRGGSHAYRLLIEYERYCNKQLNDGHIHAYTISRLHHSAFDPTKRGFKLIEETYIKQ